MPFRYLQSKKIGRGHPAHKSKKERAISQDQLLTILGAVEESRDEFNEHWKRDYTAIYLGFTLGLRIGEACILERNHFRDLVAGGDTVFLPTLKQSERIPFQCRNTECRRKVRVRWDMGGKKFQCSKCGTVGVVPVPKDKPLTGVVEKDPGFVEEATIAYILDYIQNHMRPDQRWLFEARTPGYHVSGSYLSRIFGTYTKRAGLSSKYSWHSLRHGRGVMLYSTTRDMQACKEGMRHKSLKATEIYMALDAELAQTFKKALNKRAFDPLKKLKG